MHVFSEILPKKVNIMSRRTIGRRIDVTFSDYMLNMKKQLNEVVFICTTADVWSTKCKSFMGVTVHWVCKFNDTANITENSNQ